MAGLWTGQAGALILYHYTSREGLFGILKSRALWASSYMFMNDIKEFSHASAMLKDAASGAVVSKLRLATPAPLNHALSPDTALNATKQLAVCSLSRMR